MKTRKSGFHFLTSLACSLLSTSFCFGQRAGEGDGSTPAYNWKLPTMGGTQFWTDVHHRSGWRIQRHFATGHFRLLDPENVRHAWGDRLSCEEALASKIETSGIPPNRETVLILAHGLARTAGCWVPMSRYVTSQTDWQVIDFTYASTRNPIDDHAAALNELISGLGPEVKTIHFTGHSLGNIVIRHYLADQRNGAVEEGREADPRIGRFVMIGPPNQGSRMAKILQPTGLFPIVTGSSGTALGKNWDDLKQKLAIPYCEFGIIAGGTADNSQGWNPVLRGASDGTVSLSEAMLPGAADLMVQPLFHATMMKQPEVCEATLRFLQTGCFSSNGVKRPVPESTKANSGEDSR